MLGWLLIAGCTGLERQAGPGSPARPTVVSAEPAVRQVLRADHVWLLNLPGGRRFDASGLVRRANGDLLTISDRGPQIYRIHATPGAAAADLELVPDCFTSAQLIAAGVGGGRLDCEGLAVDPEGRLYLCEESRRLVLRWDPARGVVDRLPIDWAPVARFFSKTDDNASFEGIAVGNGRLYLANERSQAVILRLDLATLRIEDSWVVRPDHLGLLGPLHYSDLSWYEGALYVLLRHQRAILEVDPATLRVRAEFSYAAIENDREWVYERRYPTGVMEGLAVDADGFWMVTDNNGEPRKNHPGDRRPLLIHCRRPDDWRFPPTAATEQPGPTVVQPRPARALSP